MRMRPNPFGSCTSTATTTIALDVSFRQKGYPVSSTTYHMLWSGVFSNDVSIGRRFSDHGLL